MKITMASKYNVVIEQDEGGLFVSEVIELPGCHTQAKSLDELLERTREAIKAYLKDNSKDKVHGKFIGLQQLEV